MQQSIQQLINTSCPISFQRRSSFAGDPRKHRGVSAGAQPAAAAGVAAAAGGGGGGRARKSELAAAKKVEAAISSEISRAKQQMEKFDRARAAERLAAEAMIRVRPVSEFSHVRKRMHAGCTRHHVWL